MASVRERLVWAVAIVVAAVFLGAALALFIGRESLTGPVVLFVMTGAGLGAAFLCGSRFAQARRRTPLDLFGILWPPAVALLALLALVAPIQLGARAQAGALLLLMVTALGLDLIDQDVRRASPRPRLVAGAAVIVALAAGIAKLSVGS